MNQTIKEVATAAVLLGTSVAAQTAAALTDSEAINTPDPETINTVMSMITQLLVTFVAIWRLVKKPKPQKGGSTI